jgi:lipoyl(octanoyl) transferase
VSAHVRRRLEGVWLGRRRYGPVHERMQRMHEQRRAGEIGDTVLFVEHEPVVTLGRGAHAENVLLPRGLLAARGVDLVETGRGGDVTLHAPGQLVCYPIVDLSPDRCDVRRYVGDLAETMRRLALELGVEGGPAPEWIGLWVDARNPTRWSGAEAAEELAKLGAIGVRISRWVTLHGFAFNLTTDLSLYSLIVPCGISSHGVTSIQALTGKKPSLFETAQRALVLLAEVIDADAEPLNEKQGTGMGIGM